MQMGTSKMQCMIMQHSPLCGCLSVACVQPPPGEDHSCLPVPRWRRHHLHRCRHQDQSCRKAARELFGNFPILFHTSLCPNPWGYDSLGPWISCCLIMPPLLVPIPSYDQPQSHSNPQDHKLVLGHTYNQRIERRGHALRMLQTSLGLARSEEQYVSIGGGRAEW